MKYYLYHIPGKKIGITKDLKKRVEEQQGYDKDEYDIIMQTDDIAKISEYELFLQKLYGYRVDEVPYNKLKFNKEMKINVTEATTTFPCPVNKLKGRLMDNIGMRWETEHGKLDITPNTIRWIMKNVKVSMYDSERSYVYNKAFARYYDNNNVHETITGGLSPTGPRSMDCKEYESHNPEEHGMPSCCNYDDPCTTPRGSKHNCVNPGGLNDFDLIRMWANERGLYDKGDTKTQALKLVEEVGEICRAILKEDHDEVVDGIGDAVVVLTNLAELQGVSIEKCINVAYNEICNRKGKMVNGTFKKINMRILIMLLLATQIQAQTLCDSNMTYTIGSQYQLEVGIPITGNSLPVMAPIYAVTYGGQMMLSEDSCFNGPCTHVVYNYNMSTGMPYDTITTCISYTLTDTSGYVDTLNCCFTQIWDGQAWMRLTSITVGINEITNKLVNNKMYDLYGREIIKAKGIYIQNRKVKYVR